MPVTPLGLEKVLHGHLPAADRPPAHRLPHRPDQCAEQRDERAADVRAAAAELDMPAVTIDGLPARPPAAGRRDRAPAADVELVHAAGTNPDLIRREEAAYKAAAAAASA